MANAAPPGRRHFLAHPRIGISASLLFALDALLCYLICVGGLNVYPNEIEDALGHMPGVLACAAIGVPDALAGEAIKVVLVKNDPGSASPSETDVRDWCEMHLSGYKRPTLVEFRPELPRTRGGKVLRRGLRDGP